MGSSNLLEGKESSSTTTEESNNHHHNNESNNNSDDADNMNNNNNINISLPKSNTEYGRKTYWDDRFSKEPEFEWLVSYEDVKEQLQTNFLYYCKQQQQVKEKDNNNNRRILRILIVGCGNSNFSSDLYDDYNNNNNRNKDEDYDNNDNVNHIVLDIVNIDYSKVVIDAMKEKNKLSRPHMEWLVMDMTDMSSFPNESFDVVIDKAAMDAIMTNEGDVWNPNPLCVKQARDMCQHISRVIKTPSGLHLQISFAQPHFRSKYLLGLHSTTTTTTTEDKGGENNSSNNDDNNNESDNYSDSNSNDILNIRFDSDESDYDDEEDNYDDDNYDNHNDSNDDNNNDSNNKNENNDFSHEFQWSYKVETIGNNFTDNKGCFHHFLYIMEKQ